MFEPYTFRRFVDLVAESRNPRILYLSEVDFDFLCGKAHPDARHFDEEGLYIWINATKVRAKINVLDLSESHLFVEQEKPNDEIHS